MANVEQFAGTDLELYGPYNEGEDVDLPAELANVLIAQGKAEQISSSQSEQQDF